MRIKFSKSFIVMLTLFMIFSCHKNSTAKSFTADMIQEVHNQRIEGKIFVKGNEYRMDTKQGGEEISVLVNRKSGKQKVIIHSQKEAYEYLNASHKSRNNNPFEHFNFLLEKHFPRRKGSEVINDYECRKIEVYKKNKNLVTAWISNKLNWPIKIETNDTPKKDVLLENIKEEPVEDSLFQVPLGYKFYPLSEDKKEKAPAKIEIPKLEALDPNKKTVVDKLESDGIPYKTREGTLVLRAFGGTVLSKIFPGWYFFLIERLKEGATAFTNTDNMKAAVNQASKNVYILYTPKPDTPLNDCLKMVHEQKIKLNDEKDLRKLGNALFFLYFRGSQLENVESLGENEWAIYKKSSSAYSDGFILKTDTNGEITELKYKTKIKKR